MQANAQLKVVRESHERSSREVAASAAKYAELRTQNSELQQAVDESRASHALIDSEMEVPTPLSYRRANKFRPTSISVD